VETLTGRQRRHLRGLAHALRPVVQVGKGGASEAVVAQIERALADHELIKVRFVGGKEEKAERIAAIVAATGAAEAGRGGHVAILYRRQPDPQKRRIELPEPT
jgi:RNA-binding protein